MRTPTLKGLTRALQALSGFLVPLVPIVAAALLAVLRFVQPHRNGSTNWRRWLTVMLPGLLLILLLRGKAALSSEEFGALAVITLLALALGALPRGAARGLIAAVVVLASLLSLEHMVAASTWHPSLSSQVSLDRYRALVRPQQLVREGEPGWSERRWSGVGSQTEISLDLEYRLAEGVPELTWLTSGPGFQQEPSLAGPAVTRISPPADGAGYVARRAYTNGPLADRTFRVDIELRTPEALSFAAADCRGVTFREVGGSETSACFDQELTTELAVHTFEWTFPRTATSELLSVELRLPVSWFEVGALAVSELTPTGYVSLGALEPAGLRVAFAPEGTAPVSWSGPTLAPFEEWAAVRVPVPAAAISAGGQLRVLLRPETGTTVEVRKAALVGPNGPTGRSVALPQRGQLWFSHPNLAAHALVAAFLVAAALLRAPLALSALAAIGATGVSFTGSRTALIALLVVTLVLLLRTSFRGPAWRRASVIVLIGSFLAVPILLGPIGARFSALGTGDGNQVQRGEIWAFALGQMRSDPLGLDPTSFQDAWIEAHVGDARPAPSHAHNFWLQFGASFGVPGLLYALALSVALLLFTQPRRRPGATVAMAGMLILQMADYTLTFLPVTVCLVLLTRPVLAQDASTARVVPNPRTLSSADDSG